MPALVIFDMIHVCSSFWEALTNFSVRRDDQPFSIQWIPNSPNMSMKNFRMQKCFGQLQGFRKEVVLQVEANMAICKAPVLASQVSMEAQSEKGSVPFKLDFFSEGPDQRVWGEVRQNSHTSQEKGSNSRTIINKVFSRLRHSNPIVEIYKHGTPSRLQENINRPTGEL